MLTMALGRLAYAESPLVPTWTSFAVYPKPSTPSKHYISSESIPSLAESLTRRARRKANSKLEILDSCASNSQGIGDIVTSGARPIGISDIEV